MALATITARVNEADKIQFDKFCNHVGINTSTAINIFVKAVLREKRIPFEISADPFYSDENMAMLAQRADDMKHGRNIAQHELIEVE